MNVLVWTAVVVIGGAGSCSAFTPTDWSHPWPGETSRWAPC